MTMQLDVAKIREPHLRIDRTDEPSVFGADEDYRIAEPVHLVGAVRKDHEKVRIAGRVTTTLELACSRCLEACRVPVTAAFDLLFLPATAEPNAPEQEVEEDDLGTSYYRDGMIDLADVVREQLFLALPMKPLCQEACKGLCSECGTNLNTGACDCTHRWDDPRLAPLKALTRTNDDA
jgi:DUF177 domain-containing protein